MKILVTFRLESRLKEIVINYFEGRNASTKFRRAIESGITTTEQGGISIAGPFGLKIPVDNISLGGDESRVNFYLDEDTLGKAKAIFKDEELTVLRRALRIGVWSLNQQPTGASKPHTSRSSARDDLTELPIDKLRTMNPDYIPLDVKAPDYDRPFLTGDSTRIIKLGKDVKVDQKTLRVQKRKQRSTEKNNEVHARADL